jgi:hypothetical protein
MNRTTIEAVIALTIACATQAAGATETVLTSVAGNVHLDTWGASAATGTDSGWSVRKITLHGGKQEGVDLITVNNGKLSFLVVPTRGMSLLRAQMGELRLGWDSPVKEVVNPAYINLDARAGLGWLDGFNEWMPRAGLEWSGHPGLDGQRNLTLHGKIGNIPASEVSVVVDEGPHPVIHIKGVVDEVSMFGANLELRTDISTEVGSNHIIVSDTITNRSALPQEFQIIYHSSYGEPLLEDGSHFVAASKEVRPLDGVAQRALSTYAAYGPSRPGFVEQVYGITPYGNADNMTTMMLRNAAGNKAVTLTYSLAELPYMALWKNTGAKGEAYVTGLEPATSFPANRSIERKAGRVPVLQPGASRHFGIDFGLLDDKGSVEAAQTAINVIQNSRITTLNPETIKPCCLSVAQ